MALQSSLFTNILVPLDGSTLAEGVLPHVVAIARVNGEPVLLLRVVDPAGLVTRPRSVDPFDWQLRKAEAETYLKGIAGRLEAAGVDSRLEILEGRTAESVIDYALSQQVGLIILSSHGQSGISGWNVSSVVQKIILRAKTAVMIIRAYRPETADLGELRYRRILVPLDGSARAEVVLPVATALAREHESELLVVHVVERPEMPRRTPPSQEDLELAERLIERNRLEAANYLEDLSNRVDAKLETRLLVSENKIAHLHSLVEEEQVDLVLMSAHGLSGDTRWPYGSTVTSFLSNGTTPLLVVQDMPPDRLQPSPAELASRERGGR